jgi:hypothetical protein
MAKDLGGHGFFSFDMLKGDGKGSGLIFFRVGLNLFYFIKLT